MNLLRAVNEIELKHTWTIEPDAWYIRFYLWLWQAKKNEVTFCKLFWGYVFVIPGLILRFWMAIILGVIIGAAGVGSGIATGARKLKNRFEPSLEERIQNERKWLEAHEERKAKKELRKQNPPVMARVLTRITHGAARVGMVAMSASFAVKNISAPAIVPPAKGTAKGVRWAAVGVGLGLFYVGIGISLAFSWVVGNTVFPVFDWVFDRVVVPLYKPAVVLAAAAGVMIAAASLPPVVTVVGLVAVAAAGAGIWRLSKVSSKTVDRICIALVGLSCVITFGSFLFSLFFEINFSLVYAATALAGLTAFLGVGYVFAVAWEKLLARYCPKFLDWMIYGPPAVPMRYAGYGVSKTGATFGEIMWMGLKAVKSNTCPRIVIESEKGDEDEDESCSEAPTLGGRR